MDAFVDNLIDSIDENGNLAGEPLTSSDVGDSSAEGQQAASTTGAVGSSKSNETKAPVAPESNGGEREGSGVDDRQVGTSGEGDETENNGSADPSAPAPETGSRDTAKGDRRNDGGKKRKAGEMSALEQAEYKAEKWKRRAKEMRRAKESLEAEFNKYKDLNPRAFENDEDRMEFLAWKASTAQRLNDMDSDLESMDQEHSREQFQAKVADCYDENGAAQFGKLDDHYRDAFTLMCRNIDPDNVILDFLSGSRYEAPMREVIYRNGKLQEELFRQFRNPMIASAERLNTLKSLERQVRDFYARSSGARNQAQRTNNAGAAQPMQQKQAGNINQNQNTGARQRFVLPSMRDRVASATASVNAARGVPSGFQSARPGQQPRNAAGQFTNGNRKATGSLTRGNEPTQAMDMSSQADALYRDLMRSGM